jgi:hypothetical protein
MKDDYGEGKLWGRGGGTRGAKKYQGGDLVIKSVIALTIIILYEYTIVVGQSNKELTYIGRFMVGNNATIVPEGIDKSIIGLPDNTTIYYAVVLKEPYSPEIEQDLKSFSTGIIKPNPYYSYYVSSSIESTKKIANITSVRWVGQISYELKLEKDLFQKITNNPNTVYLVNVVVLEKPRASEDAILKEKGVVVAYEEIPKFYRMRVQGENIFDIAKLGVVENIELVRETITTDGQISSNGISPNQSQKPSGDSQKFYYGLSDQNEKSSKSTKTDTLLFAFFGIVAFGVLLVLLRLKWRKNK